MDLNYLKDSMDVKTGVVLDPYTSYYHYPPSQEGRAFLNLFFDLMEVRRRDLETKIRQPGLSMADIHRVYKAHMVEVEREKRQFFREVKRGLAPAEMRKWNALVHERLGIDNIALFGLYEEGGAVAP